MEKQILKIIQENIVIRSPKDGPDFIPKSRFEDASKEITQHMMKFIEWLAFDNGSPFWYEKIDNKPVFWSEIDELHHDLNFVYNYWFENIYLK